MKIISKGYYLQQLTPSLVSSYPLCGLKRTWVISKSLVKDLDCESIGGVSYPHKLRRSYYKIL